MVGRFTILIVIALLYGSSAKKKTSVINYTSKVEVCKDQDSLNFLETDNLQPFRINETTSKLEGGFSFKRQIDNSIKVIMMVEKVMPSGSSEVIATHVIKDLCLELERRNQNTDYSPYLTTINAPNCPIPAGDYRAENMVADMRMLPKELILPGIYRITFTYYSYVIVGKGIFQSTKDTRLGCLSFECTVETI